MKIYSINSWPLTLPIEIIFVRKNGELDITSVCLKTQIKSSQFSDFTILTDLTKNKSNFLDIIQNLLYLVL